MSTSPSVNSNVNSSASPLLQKNLKATWGRVFAELALVVLMMGLVRWCLAEPFLVPSGSMIPTLLIKDYIFVSKFNYGLRVPFTAKWIVGPRLPQRGEVVVFRSKDDNYYYMVKRVIGLPGDKIQFDQNGHHLIINDTPVTMGEPQPAQDESYNVYDEDLLGVHHKVQYHENSIPTENTAIEVPPGHIFLMGDNRDRSLDSRVWGFLPIENIVGKAQRIWMSCKEEASSGGVICMGEDLRADRIGLKIK